MLSSGDRARRLSAFSADSAPSAIMPATNDHCDNARGLSSRTARARPQQNTASIKPSVDSSITAARFEPGNVSAEPDRIPEY